MEKTKLIDLFGMSGDPLESEELDDLLLRLESESQEMLEANYTTAYRSPITIVILSSSPTISFSFSENETNLGNPLKGSGNPFGKLSLN